MSSFFLLRSLERDGHEWCSKPISCRGRLSADTHLCFPGQQERAVAKVDSSVRFQKSGKGTHNLLGLDGCELLLAQLLHQHYGVRTRGAIVELLAHFGGVFRMI